jgi:hypothetical protein
MSRSLSGPGPDVNRGGIGRPGRERRHRRRAAWSASGRRAGLDHGCGRYRAPQPARTGGAGVHWDRLLFSAKESIYKAWYPLTAWWLGYDEARLFIDPLRERFSALLDVRGERRDRGPALTEMSGRYAITDGLVLTAVAIAAI